MSDKKISQLTAATTPLAGTEVLPIVQNGTTVKVANNDLRPKQIQSNATSGVLQITGPAAASTRVMTTPDANFVVARTDAAQTFSGDQIFGSTGAITLPTGTTAQRPTAATGMTRFNSDLGQPEFYNGASWIPYTYDATPSVTYLVVAGGGGGGAAGGSGGGAGGFRTGTLNVAAGTSLTVTVGAGGAGGLTSGSIYGTQGGNSVFSSITSLGGGLGVPRRDTGRSGGSGSGGGAFYNESYAGGSGTAGQGYAGGTAILIAGFNYGSGGGGGSSSVGADSTSLKAGDGGSGTSSSITGSPVIYAAGGGGGARDLTAGVGGSSSVGGNGGGGANNGTNAVANTGSGGGGGGQNNNTAYNAGNGSDGVVVISYPATYGYAASTTGSPTVTTSGGNIIYKWTSSGTITF